MPTIRRADPADAARLTEIAHAAKRHWGYPERWIRAWQADLTFTPDFIEQHDVFAATDGGDLVGCYALCFDKQRGWIEHFWVWPEAMGRGVGRALFAHARVHAARRGATRLEIESDPHAAGFYEKLGARRIGETVYELEGEPRVLPVLEISTEA